MSSGKKKVPSWALLFPWASIYSVSKIHDIDPNLIAAFIKQESNGDTNAMRYEPGWIYHFDVERFAVENHMTTNTEKVGQSTSWGLMQVMGTVAREYGFKGHFPQLCTPHIGIHYGCLHLKKFMKKYELLDWAISAYNAGSPTDKNSEYVENILGYYRTLKNYEKGLE